MDSFTDNAIFADESHMRLVPCFSSDGFEKAVQYKVIVESYRKAVGRDANGSSKRAYAKAFSEEERKIIDEWHTRFERWYLNTGTPRRITVELSTVDLLKRAVEFFANV